MNMKKYLSICWGILLSSLVLTTTSCRDDEWNDHYDDSANRGESKCQLVNELRDLGYAKMAAQYVRTGLDTVMNSGLQYTILALSDETMEKLNYSESEMRNLIMNATFFGSKDFSDSLVHLSLMNEKIVFERNEEEAFAWNYHHDTLKVVEGKLNQRIYNAVVHEVPEFFRLNENIITFFESQDSAYSQLLNRFSWDTLYYADGSEQKLPVFENGVITLANTRQLQFQIDSTLRAAADLEVINAENMEFLMTKNLRTKLEKAYESLQSDKAKQNFAGFDPVKTIEDLVSRDSMIYFYSKTETDDSMKFCYFYYEADTKKNEYMQINKEQITEKQLTGGNKVYFVDTVLVPQKYLHLVDDPQYIVGDSAINVYTTFNGKGATMDVSQKTPDKDRYYFFYPDKVIASTVTYWQPEIANQNGWARINIINTLNYASYADNFPDKGKGKHYFAFRFNGENLNTRKYQLSMIISAKKNSGSFNLSVETVNGQDSVSIPLYALKTIEGATLVDTIPAQDGREKGELNFNDVESVDFKEVDVDFNGEAIKQISRQQPTYLVKFTPFEIKDYTKDLYLRFTLGNETFEVKNNRITATSVYIHSFRFQMVDDNGNPVKDDNSNKE